MMWHALRRKGELMENGKETRKGAEGQSRPGKRNENRRKRRRQGKQAQGASTPKKPDAPGRRKSEKNRTPIIVPMVQEPAPTCAICGKPIEGIAQAICGPEPEQYNHFDCVLRKIADDEHVLPDQKVSYIGRGVFAIIEKDEEGHFVFVKRIPFESPEMFQSMKRYVEEQKR